MDRKEFLATSLKLGCCAFIPVSAGTFQSTEAPKDPEKEFIMNWLTDLLDTIDAETDEATKITLMAGCGRGCFRRHQFKKDIAARAAGDLEKLIEAYKKNFEIWRDGNRVHIRYGEVSRRCYCPVVQKRPAKPNDMHCNCTRATHQAIFEEALGRPFKVEIVETLRRGGKTCHFAVDVA
jgi:hypothetical protein